MKNIPNTIFLNLGEDLEDFEDFNELGEVTWCADKIGDGDIIRLIGLLCLTSEAGI